MVATLSRSLPRVTTIARPQLNGTEYHRFSSFSSLAHCRKNNRSRFSLHRALSALSRTLFSISFIWPVFVCFDATGVDLASPAKRTLARPQPNAHIRPCTTKHTGKGNMNQYNHVFTHGILVIALCFWLFSIFRFAFSPATYSDTPNTTRTIIFLILFFITHSTRISCRFYFKT